MTLGIVAALTLGATLFGAEDDFLRWEVKDAKRIALSTRMNGQVGKRLDLRILGTDRSYNYKLRATWMTPKVIRAVARLQQLSKALSDQEAKQLVLEAERAGDIVLQVEIDPREGSGVIPGDWVALLGPASSSGPADRQVRGVNNAKLRDLPALAGGAPRDYSYDVYWVVFPAKGDDGLPLFTAEDREAELTVRIYTKVGKVRWPVPEYLTTK